MKYLNKSSETKLAKVLGYIGTGLAILMFLSLFEVVRSNVVDHSHIFIQPLMTMLNCSIWSIYAILQREKFVFWANIPGVFLGLLTLLSAFIR